jgi:acetyltransferase-like isoleucine patch superfamily enzyme
VTGDCQKSESSRALREIDLTIHRVVDPTELLEALQNLHRDRQQYFQSRWQRAVPLADEIVDRWQRAEALGFGAGASVYDSCLILGDVKVGERTWIGPFTVLDGSGGLEIGSTCSISAGVQIYTHDSVKWALTGGRAEYEVAPVSIGSNTYIGPLTIVTKGVTIGKFCVVGANSIVNADLPEYSIAYGSTCRIVGHVRMKADGEPELVYDGDPGAHSLP